MRCPNGVTTNTHCALSVYPVTTQGNHVSSNPSLRHCARTQKARWERSPSSSSRIGRGKAGGQLSPAAHVGPYGKGQDASALADGLGSSSRTLLSSELRRSAEPAGTGEQTAAGTRQGRGPPSTPLPWNTAAFGPGVDGARPQGPRSPEGASHCVCPRREGTKRTKADDTVGTLRTHSPL